MLVTLQSARDHLLRRRRAGIKATLRGAAIWESIGIENAEVRVARLPDGEDPDSLLNDAAKTARAVSDRARQRGSPRGFSDRTGLEAARSRRPSRDAPMRWPSSFPFWPPFASPRAATVMRRSSRISARFIITIWDAPSSSILADAEMYARQTKNAPLAPRSGLSADRQQPMASRCRNNRRHPPIAGPSQKQWGGNGEDNGPTRAR